MQSPISRRNFLIRSGGGFGALAMSQVLGANSSLPHHAPKAKRVIQLFMNGGVSQMDTFDPKPKLKELNGQKFDPGAGKLVESVTNSPGFKVLASPFEFKQHGQSGRWVSSVFPHMAKIVDDLTFLTSMTSKTNVHGLGSYMQNTGFILPGFPCMGAWISYGLGNITKDLPEFVVMPDPTGLPYNNLGNFSAGFLPAKHQGTVINVKSNSPINYLFPPEEAKQITPKSESDGLKLLKSLNQQYAQRFPSDSQLEARIKSYELAARMQLSAPHIFDLSGETQVTKKLYGLEGAKTADFARRCIIGRRMLESGVRFVQIWSGAGGPRNNWDNHANINTELPEMTEQVDQPIAALVRDLKSRGMLEDTLVIWTTEFGRMPFSQGESGRDHNGGTFVTWLAGAGIKPGIAHGQSDEWGWKAQKEIWCYDLHATILHLMGIDHEKLSVRHNGINRRLTDVHGHVINEILS